MAVMRKRSMGITGGLSANGQVPRALQPFQETRSGRPVTARLGGDRVAEMLHPIHRPARIHAKRLPWS
jgi:hypothetical protein